ncbi:MAG: RNA polymerase factor sigma-54, partial [Candidatus Omnitrophica bacterium]|nr:RNA polymerase factor sigma-54 [Candidatus Omnitrophota bacterium]
KNLIETELETNPLLEEIPPKDPPKKTSDTLPRSSSSSGQDVDFRLSQMTKKESLQDMLLRQLGMFTNTDEDFKIGQEIIGNIDENGYLKASIEEIANPLNITPEKAENVLKIIQQFEPSGVAARTIPECLLIQLDAAGEKDPLIRKIVENHLDDVAKKNYSQIVKGLKEPLEKIEPLIKRIVKLDPKPGRNYTTDETQRVIPDIIINEKDENLEITINNEDIPNLGINKLYQDMLKDNGTDPQAKEFISNKLQKAMELLRAISKRQTTLRRIVETLVEIQQEAFRTDLSHLKPFTFAELAQKIDMHESTVCRAVMNKYVKAPYGVVALKDFFSSSIQLQNGQSVSSSHAKKLIKELIEQEDKKQPLSDEDIIKLLLEKNGLKIARRTVAKYREGLRLLSSTYRKER